MVRRRATGLAEATLFERIINGEIPAEIVYEDEQAVAFKDINPAAPFHVLVVPRQPIVSITEATADGADAHAAVLGHLLAVTGIIARQQGWSKRGFRVVINDGRDAGQEVPHLHLHLLAGRAFGWPPG